ncbi:MAG: glycosyltransferase family 4 protein [Acidimicrobiales bacterium]
MRIGMICPYSLTVPGGVQTQVLGLARALRRKGHAVRVLAPCDGPPPDAGVTPLGLSLPTAANGSVAPVAPDPSAQLRTIRAMRDEAFEVVHLHEPLAPGPTTTALLTKPAPLLGTFHMAGRSRAYEMMNGVVRYLAGRLDDRVAVSEDARRMASDSLGGDYALTFNAVELRRYDDSEVFATTGAPTILFVGRHEERKGLRVLLDAVALLPADVRVWIAGEGPETETLKAAYAGDPRLEWLGAIGEDEKIARLKGADVFCAPSLHGESFGVVLLEGMAAGTPVVASDIPGYANAARQGSDARLFDAGNHEALAVAIREVLADDGIRQALVASGRTRAEEFSMAALADFYIRRYEALVDR